MGLFVYLWVCLWVCGCGCLWVCYHDKSKLRASIFTKLHESAGEGSDHLQLIKFWPSCVPGKGVCGEAIFFGSALLQPARSVCVSPSDFSLLCVQQLWRRYWSSAYLCAINCKLQFSSYCWIHERGFDNLCSAGERASDAEQCWRRFLPQTTSHGSFCCYWWCCTTDNSVIDVPIQLLVTMHSDLKSTSVESPAWVEFRICFAGKTAKSSVQQYVYIVQ